MAIEIHSLQMLQQQTAAASAALVYFSGPDCQVCQVLKPKVAALLVEEFPRIDFFTVDSAAVPEAAAQLGVLSIPTVVAYFDGHETARLVRTFSISELRQALSRPYELMFED